jgi:hypothetical protein
MRFETLFSSFRWKQIRGCPGRFVLDERDPGLLGTRLNPVDILSGTHLVTVHSSSGARDPVFIARIEDGGLISFLRPDGSFVHTLNTAEGFERKLNQLGIQLPDHS